MSPDFPQSKILIRTVWWKKDYFIALSHFPNHTQKRHLVIIYSSNLTNYMFCVKLYTYKEKCF